MQQRTLTDNHRIMSARLAIEQADFPEPVGRLHHAQQCLLALFVHRTDAHRAFQHGIQPARWIAALEQPMTRRQAAHPRHAQQTIL
ncbi:hypothetical protein D3C84_999290 [compost metagenome]